MVDGRRMIFPPGCQSLPPFEGEWYFFRRERFWHRWPPGKEDVVSCLPDSDDWYIVGEEGIKPQQSGENCPFCGGDDVCTASVPHPGFMGFGLVGYCQGCRAYGPGPCKTAESALETWKTRDKRNRYDADD